MDEQLRERLAILETIARTTEQAARAIVDRDLDGLQAIGSERDRLFTALRAVDGALALRAGPTPDSAAARALRQRAQDVARRLTPAEATLREQLARWRDEIRAELTGARRSRGARRAYAAAEQAR